MAALLSSADGLLTAPGTLLTQDIYLRFVRPQAGEREAKIFDAVHSEYNVYFTDTPPFQAVVHSWEQRANSLTKLRRRSCQRQ